MDLSKILNLLYRYMWLLVLAALVAGLTTFFQLTNQRVSYRATTDLLIGPGLDSPSPDLNALRIGGQLSQTYAEVVDNPSFLESVNNKLDQKVDLTVLTGAISTRQSVETRLLTITVVHSDPYQAVAIANAAAQTLLEISPSKDNITTSLRTQMSEQSQQLDQTVSQSQATIQQLEAELIALKSSTPPSPEVAAANLEQQNFVVRQLGEERNRLSDSLRNLATVYQILLDTNTNQIEVLQSATTATPIDQQLWLKVLSSAIAGLIFALIIVFIAEYFDDRLRFPRDLSKAAGVPLLSTIDRTIHLKKGSGVERLIAFAQPESDAANQYREAVAKLLFSIGASIPYTLLVSSVGSKTGDEAALTAGNLAVAFAQAGYRIVLVDAQLESPVLTTVFQADKKEGLANLLGAKSSEPQFVAVESAPSICLLPAGFSSAKSSHTMLNPIRLTALFEQLKKEADIVLVAGPAISQVAEGLALATQVNAVILVARHAEARSKEVKQVVENLSLMKIKLAGVIFDYNLWPFSSKQERRTASTFGRGAPKEALNQSNLSEQNTKS